MVAFVPLAAAGAAVTGYVVSEKFGDKLTVPVIGANGTKILIGLGCVVGSIWITEPHVKGAVLGFGVGVGTEGALSMAGL